MRHGQRLLGVELHAERPGEAAAFYAWLLGPAPGTEPTSWSPVSLLFEHGVCGIHQVEPAGPPPSWVPVFVVADLTATLERARDEGLHPVELRGRTYVFDRYGVWTRLVDIDHIPFDVDPDALQGNTMVDLNCAHPARAMASYAWMLDLEQTRMLDDVMDYQLLLDDGVLALGGLTYASTSVVRLGPSWVVYFDIPDLEGMVERTRRVGVKVALPPTKEDFSIYAVLLDPFGTAFGFCTYVDFLHSEVRLQREDGRVQRLPEAMRLLHDPRDHALS